MGMVRFLQPYVAILLLALTGTVQADHPSAGIGPELAGPISTITPETLPKGVWSASLQAERNEFEEIPDAELLAFGTLGEVVHSTGSLTATVLNVAYGLTGKLTLAAHLPYIERSNLREAPHHAGDPVEVLGESSGAGDASLYGQYRFMDSGGDDGLQSAVLFGVKVPSGETHELTRDGERFEIEHQPGSGSWDPFVGFAVAVPLADISVGGSVLYNLATRGALETDLGDGMFYSVSLAHRLGTNVGHHYHSDHKSHSHGGVDLILEINGEWHDQVKVAGQVEHNTGGNMIYAAPGVRYTSSAGWAAALSIGVPLVENLNGNQSGPTWRVIGNIGVSF